MFNADDVLSYAVFVDVFCCMLGIFWSGCIIAFYPNIDKYVYAFSFLVTFQSSVVFLMIVSSPSAANKAALIARDIVISLPGWFPESYQEIKILIRQKYKKNVSLTLWKLYKIDNSLLISTLGTLVTYGFLMGSVGGH
ncbi:hypothetical protein AVEN_96229-1 [Araneus ventricosus]|uniref:Uncharacterized protein n=1 Tax=Araneus ventricosus TaxID=182803 RepID=A0A4Y2T892_ARAVE|nr:hypothetical protein AVEN_96229-1 [Araneus ventricosus]